jgi:hypothetical protein
LSIALFRAPFRRFLRRRLDRVVSSVPCWSGGIADAVGSVPQGRGGGFPPFVEFGNELRVRSIQGFDAHGGSVRLSKPYFFFNTKMFFLL